MTSARIILDSISPRGDRLTTMEVVLHRFVLAEFNTHRKFSRNSASSRAIPLAKQIERVMRNPAIPVSWPKEQKGMQGGEELSAFMRAGAEQCWLEARDDAVAMAQALGGLGVHKSVVNRLLEPFMWHTIIVSSTEWDNFWLQRCSPLAQPEIRVAAEAMKAAYDASEPKLIDHDDWHTPFIQEEEYDILEINLRCKVSAARCARVSYLTHDGQLNPGADFELYQKLVSAEPAHWSPLEHVAKPPLYHAQRPSGNFDGWTQLRSVVERSRG